MSSDDEEAAPAQLAMSRFLRTAGSDSSSDDSDESNESDDESDARPQRHRGLPRMSDASDEDGDDEPRVARILSAQEKRLVEMEATGKVIDNALKINDWVAISAEFDKLVRLVQRQHNISEPIPPFYVKTLVSLESSVTSSMAREKEAKKKMNATNAKALNSMKQKVRKSIKEYEDDVKRYQADPESFERDYTAQVSHDAVSTAAAVPGAASALQDGGEDADDFQTVGKGGKSVAYTSESILKNLQAINEARGKKACYAISEQIKTLEKLLEVAATTYQRIRVLLALISSRFDYNSSVITYMPIDLWLAAQREVDQLVGLLMVSPQYSVKETTNDYDELAERLPEAEPKGIVMIRGSVISFVDRLDDEFTKSLQNIDPHGTEYVERLKDEKVLYCTICRAEALYENRQQMDALSRVLMRRLEHVYSKPDVVVQVLEAAAEADTIRPSAMQWTGSTSVLVLALCVFLYKSNTSLLRTRAMLMHIYHHALHNEFYTARDMLLMSHLQETIHSADVATQILYNRTVVQLGLCAFRSGLIKEAQGTLQEIVSTQRVKELLAQGVHQQRFQSLTVEQEKTEKARQLPFHMHINTELIEAAFLVSSMLLEIPLLASFGNESDEVKRKAISKPFRRLLDFADRQVFTGPPESTRDHIMQASKALQEGEWGRCRDLIKSIKIWSLMPGSDALKDMLSRRIQEQGLRTYLFTYAPHYNALSLGLLARTFDLSLREVTSIVSKMLWNEELGASLDQSGPPDSNSGKTSGGIVVFHGIELSRTQQLAQTLSDKLSMMVDHNEKALDAKLGIASGWHGDRPDAKGDKRPEQAQERRGRGERTRGTRGGTRGGRGARFAQGLGNQMSGRSTVKV
ncbi:eukaryotic translation initiation factor 3 subunit 8 [Fistulina hepatica ATCC 64428]|uniref:Eukaryotic translation initiation factor 3 subunit C n=1 Tax=Fistulina hepatica ATCC 64428 TaxID=1128425 RepID=A0A0D7A1U0_9AGAR|nr:eukaryotic translation initiation factor 3 subunit 8 [Fistulina hepatica ATCC 64428]